MTTASIHDSTVACGIIDAVSDHEYILSDAAYDCSDICDYVMENTHAIPLIDTKRRRRMVDESLAFNWKEGIITRERERSRYKLRWEIERAFSILDEILHCEHIWCVHNRNYDVHIGRRLVTFNTIVMVNKMEQRSKREMIDRVIRRMFGHPTGKRYKGSVHPHHSVWKVLKNAASMSTKIKWM